jgi:hypothetical protein
MGCGQIPQKIARNLGAIRENRANANTPFLPLNCLRLNAMTVRTEKCEPAPAISQLLCLQQDKR